MAHVFRVAMAALCVCGVLGAPSTVFGQTPDEAPAIDPRAVEILKEMTDFVAGIEHFKVHTQSTLEDLLDNGQRVDFDVAADVTARRPDKVQAERVGELVDQVFYYNGKALTLFIPSDGVYATLPAPGTIEEMLDVAREELGLVIPISDLVYRNAYSILIEGVESAMVVGQAVISGVVCNHLAFGRPDVDFQIWVAAGDPPLPYKYVVTDTSTPERVSTVTVMSNWNLTQGSPDSVFEFVPPAGVVAATFIPSDETSAFGR